MAVVTSIYFSAWQHTSHDGTLIKQGIWDLNMLYPSAFTLNAALAQTFWCAHLSAFACVSISVC